MKILIEDQSYQVSDIQDILKGVMPLEGKGVIPLHYVGYMYNKEVEDCIFFLPKVILDTEGLVFHKFTPTEIIDIDKLRGDDGVTAEQRTFLYNFSIWIYQAVNAYYKRNPENIIVKKKSLSEVDFSTNEVHVTILDNILALLKFAKDNKDYLLFTARNLRSGFNKINWTQTIGHRQPLLRKEKAPIYLDPINRKKEVDYEEELLVLFFSILRYVNDTYGFSSPVNTNFELIPRQQFNKYINGYGRQRLREIKYKYFSDKTLKMWKLCYAFFAMSEKASSSSAVDDFLLSTDFDRIFESIIDDVIGQRVTDYPDYLKTQKDGKEIDHIFKYNSLVDEDQELFFIGDSKYYKTGKCVHGNSEYKQYTYAKNVIQANIDLMMQEKHGHKPKDEYVVYRDEKTEGYNITPNFFISALIGDDYNYIDDSIIHREDKDTIKVHYDNRLFDRDTLLLSHYDVNFLYVITLYANTNDYSKEVYREKVREMFRKESLARLNERYAFYVMELKAKPEKGEERKALDNALTPIFKIVNGKVFCPKQDDSYTNLILALERPGYSEEGHCMRSKENDKVLDAVQSSFNVHGNFELGSDIGIFLRKRRKWI